jgi:hypothetical protein
MLRHALWEWTRTTPTMSQVFIGTRYSNVRDSLCLSHVLPRIFAFICELLRKNGECCELPQNIQNGDVGLYFSPFYLIFHEIHLFSSSKFRERHAQILYTASRLVLYMYLLNNEQFMSAYYRPHIIARCGVIFSSEIGRPSSRVSS